MKNIKNKNKKKNNNIIYDYTSSMHISFQVIDKASLNIHFQEYIKIKMFTYC